MTDDDLLDAFFDGAVAARTIMTPAGPMVVPAPPLPPPRMPSLGQMLGLSVGKSSAVTLTKAPPGPDCCQRCGSRLRPMFNMTPRCPNDCSKPAAADPTFPLWWSHWAGTPTYLGSADKSVPEDLVRLADAVVVFEMEGSTWAGNAKVKDHEVYVAKNLTWDSTVGKFFKLTERQEKRICEASESIADSLKNCSPRAATHMACLRRA